MKALVITDMQMEMQQRIEGGRNHVNPDAPTRIAELSDAFSRRGLPIIHVRHRDENPASPLHADAAGYLFLPTNAVEGIDLSGLFFVQVT